VSERLERLAAACLLPSFPGVDVPDWIRRFVERGGAGILLFAYNAPSRGELNGLTGLLRVERSDLLLAIDEEGGDVTRLEWREGSSYPSAAGLGIVGDTALTEQIAAAIGADLASVGVNWDLAPVADVNVPGNPVIGVRAFGDSSAVVADHVAAFVRGLQTMHVAACAKHFPGHGATEQDSHLELPVVTGDLASALEPFAAAIAAGVQSIMTAHVRVPALGPEPATLNDRALRGLLRGDLGFDGVVVADALEMKALSATVGVEAAAVASIAAGADLLCVGHDLGEAALLGIEQALAAAVEDGRLGEERLADAAARVERMAAWAHAAAAAAVADGGLAAARRAVEVSGDVALRPGAPIVELRPRANIAAGEHEHGVPTATIVREGEPVPEADAYVVRDAHRHEWMREAADREGVVVVEVGLPVWRPSRARGFVATYGAGRASLAAAADVLRLELTA
jgi:beta-N-acetylhexosaminidase